MLNIIVPILLFLSSVFLILLVLIQRGRGGGLAGAFGGLGGQSAFGTKAGDLFTRITIGVAAFWIVLCAASVKLMNDPGHNILSPTLGGAAATKAAAPVPGAAPADAKTDAAKSDAAAPAATAPAAEATVPAAESAAPAAEAPAETPEKK